MKAKSLFIKGMDATEISKKMERYVIAHFPHFALTTGESLFQESHLFWLEEISDLLPAHYFQCFTDKEKFLCSCGFFETDGLQGNAVERVIFLIASELGEYAYLLCMQETDESGEERTTVIMDFLA